MEWYAGLCLSPQIGNCWEQCQGKIDVAVCHTAMSISLSLHMMINFQCNSITEAKSLSLKWRAHTFGTTALVKLSPTSWQIACSKADVRAVLVEKSCKEMEASTQYSDDHIGTY